MIWHAQVRGIVDPSSAVADTPDRVEGPSTSRRHPMRIDCTEIQSLAWGKKLILRRALPLMNSLFA